MATKTVESTAADSALLPANARGERQETQCDRSAAAIPPDAPDCMREFLKQPGAVYYGEFRYWRDNPGVYYAMKNRVPDDHTIHEFSSGPNTERVDYMCSSPKVKGAGAAPLEAVEAAMRRSP